ncbi:MAG: fasciclin domain-containing protein [Verrucomicrobiales bacterium]|nr:fasciclin domain-containing protein [Verrucomicrobiales bacterium]
MKPLPCCSVPIRGRVSLLMLLIVCLWNLHGARAASILELASGDSRFSTLVAAVQASGLAETLAQPGPFTVFAPDNDAFAKLPPGTVEALLANPERLRQVLLYHVVPGRVRSTDLVAGPVVTAQGSAARITLTPTPKIDAAGITATDVEASNGLIHIIDSVILPPPSLLEVAVGNPNFSTLVTAVQAAGLQSVLARTTALTVLAPDNNAFAQLPPGTLEALLVDTNRLKTILLYHLLPGRVRSTDLVSGKVVTLQGAAATVDLVGGVRFNGAAVAVADVEASNGIIHGIDAVLLPPPDLVTLASARPELSTFVVAVQAAGLVQTFSDAGPYTVFAPVNAAFDKLPPGTIEALIADPVRLRHLLLYHVNHGPRLRAADLRTGTYSSMQGAPLKVSVAESGVSINSAFVGSADGEAVNGILHTLDSVLFPSEGFEGGTLSGIAKGSVLTLVWSDSPAVSGALESAPGPGGPWASVDLAPRVGDGVRKVEVEASADRQFFRLRSAEPQSGAPVHSPTSSR